MKNIKEFNSFYIKESKLDIYNFLAFEQNLQLELKLNRCDFCFLLIAYKKIYLMGDKNNKIIEYYPTESRSKYSTNETPIIPKQKTWYFVNNKGIEMLKKIHEHINVKENEKRKMMELIDKITK